jgi:Flp pilus assembly protein TadG
MTKLPRTQSGFASNESGATAILFGLSFMTLCFSAAIAWDSSRLRNVESYVQEALDAAALAGAKELDPDNYDPDRIEDTAEAFFNTRIANLAVDHVELTDFDTQPNLTDRSVTAKVRVRMKSYMGGLVGRGEDIEFEPSSTTRYINRKFEIALVLDITGSMCDVAPSMGDAPCLHGTKIDALKSAAKQMVDTLYQTAPQPGAVRVSLVPYSASVNVGSAYFNAVAVTGGATDTCVMEREGINMYTNAVPSPGSLFETTGNTTPLPFHYYCPTEEIHPLTDLANPADRQSFKDSIDAMAGKWGTAGHIGLAWGWYTLSPEWNAIWPTTNEPKPYREDVMKVIVLMTDGMFNASYWENGRNLTGADTTDPMVTDSSPYQALQLCEAIKDQTAQPHGPTIYTVSFMAPASADALMQQCAGADRAYTADSVADLNAAFDNIVNRLTSLAITD